MANSESRVLVVDDCEPLRYLKTQYLLEAGYQVSQADTGRAALLSVEGERPNLVLLDVNLPDIHGSEVCREIKARWDLPVIYTSSVDIPVELHGMADACLTSIEEGALLEAVRKALEEDSRPQPQPNGRPDGGSADPVRAERLPPPEVAAQARIFQSGLLREVLDASAALLVILNGNREIVFCNHAALSLADVASLPAAVGLRLGEAFHCVHAAHSPAGCGTAGICRTCGAARAVIGGPREDATNGKWHIVSSAAGVEEAHDLMVTTAPIEGKEGLVVCTLADFSRERRRQVLERMFFHDILNAAGGAKGCAVLLSDESAGGPGAELAVMMDQCASELLSEIRGQQLLSQAEDGRLSIASKDVGTLDLVRMAVAEYRGHSLSTGRMIVVDPFSEDLRMETDPAILSRVLGGMLRNALAATAPAGSVTIGCQASQGGIEFYVHNPGVIPRAEQLQIFPRSLSTKDGARVLATYKMKLLTEGYLGGTVRFESSSPHGTRFVARYPAAVAGAAEAATVQAAVITERAS